MAHKPVLLKEVIQYLDPKPGENFIDCTVGGGGQALAILKKIAPRGEILGIDFSQEAIGSLKLKIKNEKLKSNLILICDNFANLKQIVEKENFGPIQGILLDLGLSSDLLENSGRGFSFQKDEILDMRFNPEKQSLTAEKILNQWSEEELFKIFQEYGEERFSKQIARKITKERKRIKINRTFQLANLIKETLGPRFHIKSLARIFQALRIAVNDELENLRKVLSQTVDLLQPGGKIVVISYHSLEDRIVKRFFRSEPRLQILTKKPIQSSRQEIKNNPRARSAKLRAGMKP